MKIRQTVKLIAAGTALASTSILFLGVSPAGAVDQPVTFEVAAGSLAIAQTPTAGIALAEESAVAMPVTTVTDGRNAFNRTGAWTVTAEVTDLEEPLGAVIDNDQITLFSTLASFTSGDGDVVPAEAVGAGQFLVASNDTIDSVYTYTPTAELEAQDLPYSGVYTGVVTQTVV